MEEVNSDRGKLKLIAELLCIKPHNFSYRSV